MPTKRRLWLWLSLVGLSGCLGPSPSPPGGDQRELTPEELARLLAEGTIKPVVEMEGEDAFADLGASMDGPPIGPALPPTPAVEGGQATVPPEAGTEGSAAAVAELEGTDEPVQEPLEPAPNPYLRFGERIKVNPDGTITKPYPLRVGTGKNMSDLIKKFGNFPLWPEDSEGPSSPDAVSLELLEGWDVEFYQDLRTPNSAPEARPVADWLVVTTGADLLQEVEQFINLFAAGVPQIEIEAKIVEVVFSSSLDVGIKPLPDTPIVQLPTSGLEDKPKTFIQGYDYGLPNIASGSEALLTLGTVQDGVAFAAVLEAVAGTENVSIISRPKIAVREGGRADLSNTTKIPFLQPKQINQAGGFDSSVAFNEVGVKLFVVPHVVGTDTVALNIDIEASQQSGEQTLLVTGGGDIVTSPVLSLRTARTTVYLRPGQAVILGGLITERNVDQVRKIPILGDIPIVNIFFRSKFTAKEQSNVLFFIRPRILQGVDLNREF